MNRSAIITTAVACVLAGSGPIFASSGPVDDGQAAGTHLTFALPHHQTLDLDVRAIEGAGGPMLLLAANRCDRNNTCVATDYAGVPAKLSVDTSSTTATLKAVLGGMPLTATWAPAGNGAEIESGTFSGNGTDTWGSTMAGMSAAVTVQLGRQSCRGSGGVGNGAAVDTSATTGDQTFEPLSALRLPRGSILKCS